MSNRPPLRDRSALPWELRRRGLKDSLRHDQRVKEAIRKQLRELIAEEAIITSDGTKRVKIPLRYLDQYRFKYGQPPQGVGQGEGQPGDVLGQRGSEGHGPGEGQPGDQSGEHPLAGSQARAPAHHHAPPLHGRAAHRLPGQPRQTPHAPRKPEAACGAGRPGGGPLLRRRLAL